MRKSKLLSLTILLIGINMLIFGFGYPVPETFITMKILLLFGGIFFTGLGVTGITAKSR